MSTFYVIHETWRGGEHGHDHVFHIRAYDDMQAALSAAVKRMKQYFPRDFAKDDKLEATVRELFLTGHHLRLLWWIRKGCGDNFYVIESESSRFEFNLSEEREKIAVLK